MNLADTDKDVLRFQIELYRQMPIPKKAKLIFSAYEMGKQLTMAGIRMRHGQANERQVWLMWAKRHLGEGLFEQVYGNITYG